MRVRPELRGNELVEIIEKFDEAYGREYLEKLASNVPKERLVMYLLNLMLMRGVENLISSIAYHYM